MTYGEKFLGYEVDGNIIIRRFEYRVFPHDFGKLIHDINNYVTDDVEALQDHGIFFDRNEEFSIFEADEVLEWVEEILATDTEEMYSWLSDWRAALYDADGYTIHLNYNPEWVTNPEQGTNPERAEKGENDDKQANV